jgi:hypothetical protein
VFADRPGCLEALHTGIDGVFADRPGCLEALHTR